MLNSQMGALMRAELERQDIEMADTVPPPGDRRAIVAGDLARLRTELHAHYMTGFPDEDLAEAGPGRA